MQNIQTFVTLLSFIRCFSSCKSNILLRIEQKLIIAMLKTNESQFFRYRK